jgi:hypothetical protein
MAEQERIPRGGLPPDEPLHLPFITGNMQRHDFVRWNARPLLEPVSVVYNEFNRLQLPLSFHVIALLHTDERVAVWLDQLPRSRLARA